MRDPYLYPDSDVLMNKLNIRNQSELDEAEADFVVFRLKEIAQNPLAGDYNYAHLMRMHETLFENYCERLLISAENLTNNGGND